MTSPTTASPTTAASDSTTVAADVHSELRESDRQFWRRHPGDAVRLVWRSVLLFLLLFVTAFEPNVMRESSADLVQLFIQIPERIRYVLVALAQLTIVVIPLLVVAWLILRRSLLEAAMVVGSGVAAGLLMLLLTDWLDDKAPPQAIAGLDSTSFLATDFPSTAYLAALVAGAATASPLMSDQWRRVAWFGVIAAVVVRVLTATQTPVNVAVTVALGLVVGSAALVVLGSPRRRPGAASLKAELAAAGLEVDDLHDEVERNRRRSYQGTTGGDPIEVVYLDRDDRDVDLLARVVRTIRVRSVDEESLALRPASRVQHQAVVTLMAQQAGANVPSVRAVAAAPRESALIALDVLPGRPLSDLGAEDVSDVALDDLWRQLGRLHADCVAHRSLTRSNLLVDGDTGALSGLENGRLAANNESRALDVAEMLVSTALVVGPDRAIAASIRNVDSARLEQALAFVQPPALPSETRKAAHRSKDLVTNVRTGLQESLGVDAIELADLDRVTIPKLITWVGFAVLAFILLTFASSWSEMVDAFAGIDWWWVAPIVVVTLIGPVFGAMTMMGAVLRPLALGDTTVVMFGQSYLNRFTPMNAGGMAMRIRYLQKGGTDVTVATAAIGLTSLASGVVQVLYLVFFVLWSSTDPSDDQTSGGGGGGIDGTLILIVAMAVVVAVVVVVVTPKFRKWLIQFAKTTFSKLRHDFGLLARMPSKLGMLFGGAALSKLMTILAFVFACRAFDIDLSFAQLGALYMIANTIASAVPTPGGVGAVEAALVLVLTNAGVDQGTAWAAASLFRLINYWLPTIPGFVGLKLSERRELI